VSSPSSAGILASGVGYAYWNEYYSTIVVHNMFATDGGTAYYSKNANPYADLEPRVVAKFTEFLGGTI
jgi:hypothetical protein